MASYFQRYSAEYAIKLAEWKQNQSKEPKVQQEKEVEASTLEYPLARIKKIVKRDREVKQISAEALDTIAKATVSPSLTSRPSSHSNWPRRQRIGCTRRKQSRRRRFSWLSSSCQPSTS